MTLKDLLFFGEVNHTKVNNFQELVHNVTLFNWATLDLIEVAGRLMQLVGVENKRIPFLYPYETN